MLTIKEELHKKIDLLNDLEQLNFLNETVEIYLSNSQNDDLTAEQYERLEKSMEEIKKGNFITHDEMQEKMKKWLLK